MKHLNLTTSDIRIWIEVVTKHGSNFDCLQDFDDLADELWTLLSTSLKTVSPDVYVAEMHHYGSLSFGITFPEMDMLDAILTKCDVTIAEWIEDCNINQLTA